MSALGGRHEENPLCRNDQIAEKKKAELQSFFFPEAQVAPAEETGMMLVNQQNKHTQENKACGHWLQHLQEVSISPAFSPSSWYSLPWACSVQCRSVNEMVPLSPWAVGGLRRKACVSHFGTLSHSQKWHLSKLMPSALLKLPWVRSKEGLTLNQARSYPSQNPGLSGTEIS